MIFSWRTKSSHRSRSKLCEALYYLQTGSTFLIALLIKLIASIAAFFGYCCRSLGGQYQKHISHSLSFKPLWHWVHIKEDQFSTVCCISPENCLIPSRRHLPAVRTDYHFPGKNTCYRSGEFFYCYFPKLTTTTTNGRLPKGIISKSQPKQQF